ncbi:probable calcium-binding protein CML48 isoform X2 [Prosopis cineraria]|uniref:probable calcium-binding protein CML48 isoform X2 n=1 Tax=Prosopis cineraria TaxID=364024 RepID=UPI0024103EED|nr:probable calcium-binding protein CML48 isoform X2 [Prosopis cineraria]
MSSYGRYSSQSYAPSAPTLPEEPPYNTTSTTSEVPPSYYTGQSTDSPNYHQYGGRYQQSSSATSNYPHGSGYGQGSANTSSNYYQGSGYGHVSSSSSGYPSFPPGTHPDVIRSFQAVDRDRSGFIEEKELQQALSNGFHKFDLRTIRFLMFLFKNPNDPIRIGPKEFAALWSCLGHWRAIFERYDRDRSGKIDPLELRDALYGIGYAVPASVLQLLLSKYSNGSGGRVELGFDSFVECGMVVKVKFAALFKIWICPLFVFVLSVLYSALPIETGLFCFWFFKSGWNIFGHWLGQFSC